MLVFFWLDARPDRGGSLPLPHTVPADTSLVLLCLTLMLGAAARVVPRLRRVVPWGRELGIAMFVTAGLHIAILVGPNLEVSGFFGDRSFRGFEFGTRMWDAANWVGVVALGYALVLAATSNDWSQRKLGRGWKFLQRQAYTLFALAWLHTAAFVRFGAGHGAALFTWFSGALPRRRWCSSSLGSFTRCERQEDHLRIVYLPRSALRVPLPCQTGPRGGSESWHCGVSSSRVRGFSRTLTPLRSARWPAYAKDTRS
jgi:DMSO/TMAO reductase YedYZ heme-binding membrane subunit